MIPAKENTIGIVGGGQLARMSAQAAERMGIGVIVLDSDPNCPAGQVTPFQIAKDWNSDLGTADLAKKASVLTLENEWVNPDNLLLAERLGATVIPGPSTLSVIGDKYEQRLALAARDLPSPRFRSLTSWNDLHAILAEWGSRLVLKSRRGGYDGYGVIVLDAPLDGNILPTSDATEWYVEEFIPFERELAVMVSKNSSGQVAVYPVVESRQTDDAHRCDLVIAPAPGLSAAGSRTVEQVAIQAVDAVGGIGLYGIELFQCGDRYVVNEIAPRPHNSGHYTMDGCRTSQFEQHIRSIRNLPPGSTELLAPVVVMANLLAPRDGKLDLRKSTAAAMTACPNIHLHWYGKAAMRSGRKMGHMNLLGNTVESALEQIIAARDAFWKETP